MEEFFHQGEQQPETQALPEGLDQDQGDQEEALPPRKRISRSNARYAEMVAAGIRAPQDDEPEDAPEFFPVE